MKLAREAFAKAFELNSDLPIAHSYYTYFEIEELSDLDLGDPDHVVQGDRLIDIWPIDARGAIFRGR